MSASMCIVTLKNRCALHTCRMVSRCGKLIRGLSDTARCRDKRDDSGANQATEIVGSEATAGAADDGQEASHSKDLVFRKKFGSREVFFGKEFSGLSEYEKDFIFKEDPNERVKRVMKYDFTRFVERQKRNLGFDFESKLSKYYLGPTSADIVIIGGGVTGWSCAYWIKEKTKEELSVVVIEKDLSHRSSSTSLSVSGLCQQFSLPENIQMALFGSEFLRSMGRTLKVDGLPVPTPCYEPCGCLLLAGDEDAELLTENSKLQNELGAKNVLLNPKRIKDLYPWMNTDDIVVGCLGTENEGWFDPWALKSAFKSKAISLGTDYINGEVVGFHFHSDLSHKYQYEQHGRRIRGVLLRRPDGKIHSIEFHKCVLAAGAESGFLASLTGMGSGRGVLVCPLPIEPRRRYMYLFHSDNGPGLNTPHVVGPDGVMFRREGLTGDYVTGASLRGSSQCDGETWPEVIKADQLFEHTLKPSLLKRVGSFSDIKLEKSWSGFYQHNYVDTCGVIGPHPLYTNIVFACGFNGLGKQNAPAVGRAVSEIIVQNEYLTIDLTNLGFGRFAKKDRPFERSILALGDDKLKTTLAIE